MIHDLHHKIRSQQRLSPDECQYTVRIFCKKLIQIRKRILDGLRDCLIDRSRSTSCRILLFEHLCPAVGTAEITVVSYDQMKEHYATRRPLSSAMVR